MARKGPTVRVRWRACGKDLQIGHLSEHSATSGTVGIGSGNVAGTRRDTSTALAVRGDREVS
jgi:hypothetical protein